MFYSFIKVWVRAALKIFCPDRVVVNQAALHTMGPVLLVSNHPNSFLDAVIIGAVFNRPVHFLARGDAFNKPWHARLLGLLKMIPIYRLSEGKENLALNDQAFQKSREVLENGGALLIFIEGICVNKHELQPFKKGAARIAIDGRTIPGLKILPVGIGYDSFRRFGKKVVIEFGTATPVSAFLPYKEEDVKNMRYMNDVLFAEIAQRVHVPAWSDKRAPNPVASLLSQVGRFLHLPYYTFIKTRVAAKTKGTVFFDSVLFGVLLFTYPLYLLCIAAILLLCKLPVLIVAAIIILHLFTAHYVVMKQRTNSNKVTLSL